ncbi:MAG: 2-C-methyl-D-erythritol 2,4-cyclodiphosphate synthase [Clostridia bacterium]|nr:2-C-methyl-D-erythritol 2,4-cyclodiphosphate synthase [Clostridia bacterium]
MSERFAIGQDSHAFEKDPAKQYAKPLVLGGIVFDDMPCLSANSDGDVVLHALTNAISGITCKNILGSRADEMCRAGITDSAMYLKAAMEDLEAAGGSIVNVSVSIEAARPKFHGRIPEMRESLAKLLGIAPDRCGITATSGEGLTAFGRGEGIAVFAAVTVLF